MSTLPSVTVAEALGSMPEVIDDMLGEQVLAQCLTAAGLPENVSSSIGHFIPEIALNRLLDSAARKSGDEFFGLVLVDRLSVKEYGVWGQYILEAPTLISALKRAVSIIHLHADSDKLSLRVDRSSTFFEYTFGERTERGYPQVALAALGPLLSVPRHFKGPSWRPLSIGLDFGTTRSAKKIEKHLKTKVRCGEASISIEIENADLPTRNPNSGIALVTREDVKRACNGGPPQNFASLIEQLIIQRLGSCAVTLDEIASTMAVSTRSLQRYLDSEGTSFRAIADGAKMRRAAELLADTSVSVAEVALILDYSTRSHFARAFRRVHGTSPLEFRAARSMLV